MNYKDKYIQQICEQIETSVNRKINSFPDTIWLSNLFELKNLFVSASTFARIYSLTKQKTKTTKATLDNLAKEKKISTLGKWLPREKSSINKKCGFVDKFCKLFFPKIKNKFQARREYRKTKTLINQKLGTIETKICGKLYKKYYQQY